MSTDFIDSIQSVVIDWWDDKETVVVEPRDHERFEVQKDVAINALRLVKQEAQFQNQFALLMKRLAAWIRKNRSGITNAYLTLQDGSFAFVVVKISPRYDADFEDALSELDLSLANDPALDLLKLDAIALPPVTNDALLSFLDTRFVLSYHGK